MRIETDARSATVRPATDAPSAPASDRPPFLRYREPAGLPPSTSPWARDDQPPEMMDGVQFQTRRAKGELSRNDIYFEEPWGTTEKEEDRVKGVPPPGFFGNGWKHPERPPRPVDYSNLPYGTRLTVESRPPPALKPNQERPKLEEVGVDPRFRLRSTSQAFNEVRPGESAGAFAPDAKKKYLAELKLQMDSQKANRRMEHLQHFGWDVGSKPDPRRELFAQFDQDGSGTIDAMELRQVMRHPKVRAAFKMSGDGKDQLTEEEIDAFAAELQKFLWFLRHCSAPCPARHQPTLHQRARSHYPRCEVWVTPSHSQVPSRLSLPPGGRSCRHSWGQARLSWSS